MAWQATWNGTVRSTALAVRLRACPVPKSCLASSIATSIAQRDAYRSMTRAAVAAAVPGLRRSQGGAIMEPGRGPDLLPPPAPVAGENRDLRRTTPIPRPDR